MPLDPDIAMLITEIDANLSHAESITHGLSNDQWNWRSAPDQWSIGQCLAHLNLTNSYTLRALASGIAQGHGKTGQGPFQYGPITRKFIASQEPPATKKFKAPKQFVPTADPDRESTISEYQRSSAELKRLTREADGLHLSKVKVKMLALPAPLRAIVRIPLGGQLHLTTTHDRRHLWQAEQVRNHPQFPA